MSSVTRARVEEAVAAMPRGTKGLGNKRIPESLLNNIAMDECWPWQGAISKTTGYGHGNYPGQMRAGAAHRIVYELVVGTIPAGMQIDHLCHDPHSCGEVGSCAHRRCVNPNHLAVVTPRENTLRSGAVSARNLTKTECPKGHSYDPENTYQYRTRRGGPARGCRECRAEASRQYEKTRVRPR